MPEPMLIAKSERDLFLLPGLANRHGLVTGATGTGKTVTLQRMAEQLSASGVPVFMADVKGDLSGLSQAGAWNPKLKERAEKLGFADSRSPAFPRPSGMSGARRDTPSARRSRRWGRCCSGAC
jgi:DNA helicase HerA-like ATPase